MTTKAKITTARWAPIELGAPRRWLLTGSGGTGQSYWAASSFWDPLAMEPVMIGEGASARPVRAKMLVIGQENIHELGIPESYISTGSGRSFRLKSANLDSEKWIKDFTEITTGFVVAARDSKDGPPLDVIIIDSVSESVLLQQRTYDNHGNKFATWDHLETMWFSLFQRLDPRELGCHVIMTARPMERDTGIITTDEDGHKVADKMLAPSMRGNFLKNQLSCYFDMAFYIRSETRKLEKGPRAGMMGPAHVMHVIPNGRYDIKNTQEERWLYKGYPDELVNTGFWDVQGMLEGLMVAKS